MLTRPWSTPATFAMVFAISLSAPALASPITVNGFTKVVDGTTPYPNNPGYFIRGGMLYADGDSFELSTMPSISNDGANVAFIACAEPGNCFPTALSFDGVNVGEAIPGVTDSTVDYAVSRDGDSVGILHLINFFNGPVRPELYDASTGTLLGFEGINATGIAVDDTSMAYRAETTSDAYIRMHDGAGIFTITSTGAAVPGGGGALFTEFLEPDISAGNVVFTAEDMLINFSARGLYTDSPHCPGCSGPAPYKIAREGEIAPVAAGAIWDYFYDKPAIDGTQIVFVAEGELAGGARFEGIFVTDTSGTTQIVDFIALGIAGSVHVDISGGTVAYGVGETQIRLWNGGDTTVVLSAGNLLDGKIVSKVRIVRDALSDNSLAFPVEFTDGSEAIYLAEFTPAPIDVGLSVEDVLHPHHIGGGNVPDDSVSVVVHGSSIANGDLIDFFTDDIDETTVRFAPNLAAIDPASTSQFNIDKDLDGDDDVRVFFKMVDTGMACPEPSLTLTGQTTALENFEGTDSALSFDCNAGCH